MKGLIITLGTFSGINASLVHAFNRSEKVNCTIIDIEELVSQEKYSLRNWIYLIFEYGIDFLLRRKSRYSWRTWLLVTSYMHKVIRKKVAEEVQSRGVSVEFTLQTQSMFNGAVDGIPHFVYTDSTVLANQHYPNLHPATYMKSKTWMKLEPNIYHDATMNFVFSFDQRQSLLTQYAVPEQKVVWVGAGSNVPLDQNDVYGKEQTQKRILFVGVNWERKGGQQLYHAFRRLRKTIPVELDIVGCEPNLPEMAGITIHGRISQQEVDELYKKASVFCLPTLQEPFGIVFVEAMHRKLPVVATDVGAIPDLVENAVNGYRVPPFDEEALYTALHQILTNPSLQQSMSEASWYKAQEYTWEKTVDRMVNVIRQYV